MEFSYKLSEAEYIQASKLGRKASSRSVFKVVLFWVFILICLMLLWAVVQKSRQRTSDLDQQAAVKSQANGPESRVSVTHALLVNIGPFVLLGGIWVFVLFNLGPIRLRRIYRKDPFVQGECTVNLTSESILVRNTAGTSSQTGWNVYKSWREGNGIIVLVFHSGACFGMSLAGLSNPQRDELRSILAAALPKK